MTKSESIAELAKALAKAQGEITGAIKDADNPCFNSRYADLASVWDACRLPLSRNGLSVVQMPEVLEIGIAVETMLLHASGEFISSTITMRPMKPDPQGIGSCVTYARRYALSAMVGIAPEDDDGNAASGRDKPDPRQQRREQAAETARTQPASEIPPAQSNAPATETAPAALGDWWKSVVCHVGKPGGDMIDKAVGELRREHLEWIVGNVKARTVKGTNLLNAAKAALAAMPKDEPPAPASPPEDDLDLSPSPAKPEAVAKPWREVVTHSIGKKLGGKKLGDLVDAKAGDFLPELDGPAILRRLASEAGIAMITQECANEAKRDELIAAIRAAADETKPYDDHDWLASLMELELRSEVCRRIAELGVTPEAADKTLEESGLETVEKSSEAELRHVIAHWSTVATALKGGE